VKGTTIAGSTIRVAVRLWLGAAPRSSPPGRPCRCGWGSDAEGRHFMPACLKQAPLRKRRYHHRDHVANEVLVGETP